MAKKPKRSTARKPNKAKEIADKRQKYGDVHVDDSYQSQKNYLWSQYQATYFPAFQDFRISTIEQIEKLAKNPAKNHKSVVSALVRIRKKYIKTASTAFLDYIEHLTLAYAKDKLVYYGMDLKETAKIAAEYEITKDVPKPKSIKTRKEAKAAAKSKTTRRKSKK